MDTLRIAYDKISPAQIRALFERVCRLEELIKKGGGSNPTPTPVIGVCLKIQFVVGAETTLAQGGDSTFILKDKSGVAITGKIIELFREGEYQYPVADYTYNQTTGEIQVIPDLNFGEHIVIDACPIGSWAVINFSNTTVVEDDLLADDSIILFANDTDPLLL